MLYVVWVVRVCGVHCVHAVDVLVKLSYHFFAFPPPIRLNYLVLDVDSGDTVTDFLPMEQERGITIQSAAVTVDWCDPASL
jgi:hypothetical protein